MNDAAFAWMLSPSVDEAVDDVMDDGGAEQDDPLRIPLPDPIDGPCTACIGEPGNPLFWEDRFGVVRCCGCHGCPSRIMFKRLLVMQMEIGDGSPEVGFGCEYWFVERDSKRNPWAKGVE